MRRRDGRKPTPSAGVLDSQSVKTHAPSKGGATATTRASHSGDDFAEAARQLGRKIEIVRRNDDLKGFQVLPKRWIVEQTFAWLGRYRRLSKDDESLVTSIIAIIQFAMTTFMLHRLQPGEGLFTHGLRFCRKIQPGYAMYKNFLSLLYS